MDRNNDYNVFPISTDRHSGFPVKLYPHIGESGTEAPFLRRNELVLIVSYHGVLRLNTPSASVLIQTGQAALINSGVLHSISAGEGAVCAGITFSDEFIAPAGSDISVKYIKPIVMASEIAFLAFDNSEPWHSRISSLAFRAVSLVQHHTGAVMRNMPQNISAWEDSSCFELEVHCLISELWRIMYSNISGRIGTGVSGNEHVVRRRTQLMVDYIHKNYSDSISLSEIAAAANISKSEASRCFQSCLHVSPVSYLLHYRVEMAADLLQSTSMTIEEISFECGFGSASYFCKMFQRYAGMTPGRFRKGASEKV